MAKSITLLIPGLLDNLPDPVPLLPALETLLARGDCRTDLTVGFERTLMHLFSQAQSQEYDVPEGAFSRYAQTGEKPDGVWLCAAPVHLFADQSRVYLNAIDEMVLSEEEAAEFIAELNKVYAEDGWEFVQHTSTRWYLCIPGDAKIRTTPLHEVDGKSIHDKLPQGDDALQWHRAMNEMQMLFHSSSVNQARQERGEVAVNGVWLWGSGEFPGATNTCQWHGVYTSELLATGLALFNGDTVACLPPSAEQCLQQTDNGEYLIVFPPLPMTDKTELLSRLERDWFAPLLTAMQNGAVESVTILSADGRQWNVSRRNLRYFWRRRRSLKNYRKYS